MRQIIMLSVLLGLVAACGQGGRDASRSVGARDASTENSTAAANEPAAPGEEPDVLIDPLGELLQPVGLGYRVDTILGEGENAIRQTAYGVDALPVGVDVDGDSSTGDFLGADISVHFFSLLLYARLQIDRLPGAPADLPLSVEVSILDPRNLLGLPGLVGVVDPDLRIALGMDARGSNMPGSFSNELKVLDSLVDFLPRFTSAQMAITSSDAVEELAATLAMYADRGERRHDGTVLRSQYAPAVSDAAINVVLAPDAEESSLTLSVSSPSVLTLGVRTYDGPEDAAEGERTIDVALDQIGSSFDLQLTGVDGLDALEDRDTSYRLLADQEIASMRIDVLDQAGSGEISRSEAHILPLPTSVDVIRSRTGGLTINTSATIDDIFFAQTQNAPIIWMPGEEPGSEFREHLLRITERDDGTEILQARLGGIENLAAEFDPDLSIDANLQPAPFSYRQDDQNGFTQARLELLPGSFEIKFPDDDDKVVFSFSSNAAGPGLFYERQDGDLSTIASIVPIPQSFSFCAAGDDACGSNGRSTDASILIEATEHMLINYHQRSTDGGRETAISDLFVKNLAVDAGSESGFRKGYFFFDTLGEDFSGEIMQRDGGNGLYLLFSEGTFAEQRRVRFKNYLQIEERSGTMKCPGRDELEIRSGGTWYDAGFVLDQLCQ